ncbi:DUF4856 domain-containing protein [Lacinutrix jangbogonensis]|uniref:DUF4856 domain-containing protein n=1 Tax=Lacinutrix jangbogonensis TaxID=1469557 RepID=UPI00053EEE70|nr:DUF4856 domain-containing protein [Lacinutrix jangbogonensis]
MNKLVLGFAALAILGLTSCSNDDDNTPILPPTNNVTAPDTYVFERNGANTVFYTGQTTRILMAEELIAAIKDPSKTEIELDAMFAHQEGATDFSDATLNASGKSVRSKTAASTDFFSANTTVANAIKADFDGYISDQANNVFPNWGNTASIGVAGQIQEAAGGTTRYVNGKGLENNQALNKGLIGALMIDQMLNSYLGTAVLDAGDNRANNDAAILDGSNDYTTMEHKWDEAFGYLYGKEVNAAMPALGADNFLNKYLARVENDTDFAGIAMDVYNAFKLGRAAIVAKNYEVRDAQAEIIRGKISEIVGIRAVYYLQQAKGSLGTDWAAAFHDLSEGYGFIYSLQFTRKAGTNEPYFTKTEVDGFIATLMAGNGFWELTGSQLDAMSNTISAEFNFTIAQAGS